MDPARTELAALEYPGRLIVIGAARRRPGRDRLRHHRTLAVEPGPEARPSGRRDLGRADGRGDPEDRERRPSRLSGPPFLESRDRRLERQADGRRPRPAPARARPGRRALGRARGLGLRAGRAHLHAADQRLSHGEGRRLERRPQRAVGRDPAELLRGRAPGGGGPSRLHLRRPERRPAAGLPRRAALRRVGRNDGRRDRGRRSTGTSARPRGARTSASPSPASSPIPPRRTRRTSTSSTGTKGHDP